LTPPVVSPPRGTVRETTRRAGTCVRSLTSSSRRPLGPRIAPAWREIPGDGPARMGGHGRDQPPLQRGFHGRCQHSRHDRKLRAADRLWNAFANGPMATQGPGTRRPNHCLRSARFLVASHDTVVGIDREEPASPESIVPGHWHVPTKRMIMDPTQILCPTLACPAGGPAGTGNIQTASEHCVYASGELSRLAGGV
jgi:hypothetical protein